MNISFLDFCIVITLVTILLIGLVIGPVCWLYDKIKYAALLEKVYSRLTIFHSEEEKEFFESYRRLRLDIETELVKASHSFIYLDRSLTELKENLGRLRSTNSSLRAKAMSLDRRLEGKDLSFYFNLSKFLDKLLDRLNGKIVAALTLRVLHLADKGMKNGN